MNKFQSQFVRARNCGIPLIAARSADAYATRDSIVASLNGKSDRIPVVQWDVMRGISGIGEPGKAVVDGLLNGQQAEMVSARPSDCLGMIVQVPDDTIVLMHNLHMYWEEATSKQAVIQGILNLRDRFKATGCMLVALNLTGSMLPSELTEHTLTLDDSLPTTDELATLARENFQNAGLQEPDLDTITQACNAVQGLSAFAADQSIALNMSKSGLDLKGTWDRKRQMIESDGLLKVYSGPESFATLGGNEGFKTFCRQLFTGNEPPRAVILMDEIEKAVSQDSGNSTKTALIGLLLSWFQDRRVDGVLENGVPGAGKTAGVKSLGNEFGVPVILFNLASMENQFVGNSQKRLITALDRIDAMCGGKPCVFATCNKLESLSPELRSRFKLGTFFYDLPTETERASVWTIYLQKFFPEGDHVNFQLPDATGWTPREIEECCYKAWRFNIPLLDAAKCVIPVSRSSAESIRALRLQASGKFLSASDSGIYRFEETASVQATGRKFRD